MTTGAEFALFTDKKLMGFIDFQTYLIGYMQNSLADVVRKNFVQGSFREDIPLSSPGAGQVQIDLKVVLGDGFVHDGAGHLLDLEQIDRTATFENTAAQVYEVGAGYVAYPAAIRINPRTGDPEYDHYVEGVGVQATPDAVSVGVSTLTFQVDALFEQGVAVGNHAGRQVRVFRITPGDIATTGTAIETCTVFYGGGQNQITTTGLLGQTVANTENVFYVVQLIGITILKDTATNRPTQNPESVFFAGTVTGNGGTPTVFDTSGQVVIQGNNASDINVQALGNWADGTTNPAADLQTVLDKIVSDLTSTTGGYGAAKLTAAALANWADGTTNPAATLGAALAKIVTDLTSTSGARGAGKLTAPALTGAPYSFAAGGLDETLQLLADALNEISVDTGALRGVVDALTQWRTPFPIVAAWFSNYSSAAVYSAASAYVDGKFVAAANVFYNDGAAHSGICGSIDGGSGFIFGGPAATQTGNLIAIAPELISGNIVAIRTYSSGGSPGATGLNLGTATSFGITVSWAVSAESDLMYGVVSGKWWVAASDGLHVSTTSAGTTFNAIAGTTTNEQYVREFASGRIVVLDSSTNTLYYIDPPYSGGTMVAGAALSGVTGSITGFEMTSSGLVMIDEAGKMFRSVDGSAIDASVVSFVDANMQMLKFGVAYGYDDMLVFVPYNVSAVNAFPDVQVHPVFADTPVDVITLPPTGPFAQLNSTTKFRNVEGFVASASVNLPKSIFASIPTAQVTGGGGPF